MSMVQLELADQAVEKVDRSNMKRREDLRDQSRLVCNWITQGFNDSAKSPKTSKNMDFSLLNVKQSAQTPKDLFRYESEF